jgi:predicted nucleic acid-binding protein
MSDDRVFLDSNVLVYAYDASAGAKWETARSLVADLWASGSGVLSTQVLQEFYVNVTKKIPKPLSRAVAKTVISDLLKWDVVINDGSTVLEAIDLQEKRRISFWDSMIIQAAIRGRAKWLFSEDLSDGEVFDGVEIRNPFKDTLH